MNDFDSPLDPDFLTTQKPNSDISDKSRVSRNTKRLQTLFKQSPNKWRSQDVEVTTPTNKLMVSNNISSSPLNLNKLEQIREENQADENPVLRLEVVQQFQPYEPFGTVINQNGYSEDDKEHNNSEEDSYDKHKPWIQGRTMSQGNGLIIHNDLMHSSSIVALSNKSVGLMIKHLKKEKDWK